MKAIDLQQVLSADDVIPKIVGDASILEALYPHLPEEHRSADEVARLLRSPQFRQTLDVFAHAMNAGQLSELMRQFKLNPEVRLCHRVLSCLCVLVLMSRWAGLVEEWKHS